MLNGLLEIAVLLGFGVLVCSFGSIFVIEGFNFPMCICIFISFRIV